MTWVHVPKPAIAHGQGVRALDRISSHAQVDVSRAILIDTSCGIEPRTLLRVCPGGLFRALAQELSSSQARIPRVVFLSGAKRLERTSPRLDRQRRRSDRVLRDAPTEQSGGTLQPRPRSWSDWVSSRRTHRQKSEVEKSQRATGDESCRATQAPQGAQLLWGRTDSATPTA